MTPLNKHEQIRRLVAAMVNESVNGIFSVAHKLAATSAGDLSPAEALELERIKDQLTALISNQVAANLPAAAAGDGNLYSLTEFLKDALFLEPLHVGQRVVLARDVDRFPSFVAPKGSTGTVTLAKLTGEKEIRVKLDNPVDGAEEWDNCIIWNDPSFDVGTILEFNDDCTKL